MIEPIYFELHTKKLFFSKDYRGIPLQIRSADTFPSLVNKERINLFFQNQTNGAYNIVRLCLIPDETQSEKTLKKCFPIYTKEILENITNCQGIQFHIRDFEDSQWLGPDGFRIIKEKYPETLLILDINSGALKDAEYQVEVVAKKIFMYQQYIDAVIFNFNPQNFKNSQEMDYFSQEISHSLKVLKKSLL